MTVRLLSFGLAATLAIAVEPLTQGERDRAMSHLHSTRKMLLDTVAPLTEAQWKFKPGPDRWSVLEVVEHIGIVENFLLENTSKNVMQAPAGKPDRDYKSTDKLVLSAIADRTQRVQAPEPVLPTGRRSPQEALDPDEKIRSSS